VKFWGGAAVSAAAVLVVACSSSKPSGSSAPNTPVPGGDPVAGRTDPCKVFTVDQLKQGLGADVQAGHAVPGSLQPSCQWLGGNGGPTVVATVSKATEANYDSDLTGPVAHDYQRSSPVVGDDSVWFGSADDQKSSVSLLVLKSGYQYQLTVGNYASIGDEATTKQKLLAVARGEF
jgi:hypothetical protein